MKSSSSTLDNQLIKILSIFGVSTMKKGGLRKLELSLMFIFLFFLIFFIFFRKEINCWKKRDKDCGTLAKVKTVQKADPLCMVSPKCNLKES